MWEESEETSFDQRHPACAELLTGVLCGLVLALLVGVGMFF